MKKNYSQLVPKILNKEHRLRIAAQIIGVLQVYPGEIHKLSCLDVGCSNGVITNYLAKYFNMVTGIDVDSIAIKDAKSSFKTKNLSFFEMSGQKMLFKDKTFDIVICNQIYNFVENPQLLIKEIHRVLNPDGICFFAARNKYALWEPQYNLPLLSWLPKNLATLYLRIFKGQKIFMGKNYMSYAQLRELVSQFEVHDYTLRILKEPAKFAFYRYNKYALIAKFLPKFIEPLMPNFIWLLKKYSVKYI